MVKLIHLFIFTVHTKRSKRPRDVARFTNTHDEHTVAIMLNPWSFIIKAMSNAKQNLQLNGRCKHKWLVCLELKGIFMHKNLCLKEVFICRQVLMCVAVIPPECCSIKAPWDREDIHKWVELDLEWGHSKSIACPGSSNLGCQWFEIGYI